MDKDKEYNHLKLIARGDHHAFRILFMKYFPKIKYFIAHMIKSESIADELTQDIFLKIWESRRKLPDIRSFNSYLYRMAKHAAINYLEHRYIENSYIENVSQSASTNPEEELEAKELEFLISLLVERMPKQRSAIYTMSRVKHVKHSKIAENLGISEKTVNNQLSLALKEIRKLLEVVSFFFY